MARSNVRFWRTGRLTGTLALVLASVASASAAAPGETVEQARERHELVAARRARTHVICHRGASEFAHENTLEAYRAALELGADGNEIDIRRTRDGVLVCFHDDMLDRILTAFGDTPDVTWDELRRYRFREPGRFGADCRIPTLDEVFELHRRRGALLHLDIKRPGLDQAIAELLDKHDLWDHVAYCNQANGGKLLADPRMKLARYKAGIYLDRGEMFPEAIQAALAKPGDGLIVDDPRGALLALGRPLGRVSRTPVAPLVPAPEPLEAPVRGEAELVKILTYDADWNRPAQSESDRRDSARKIEARARAADQLGRLRELSPAVRRALADRVERRSLHRDWMYHGLDGALALRTLLAARTPEGVAAARAVLWRDDPALTEVANPEFKNPRSWTDFRLKMLAFPGLAGIPGAETEKICRDYLALSDEAAKALGPDQFEAAGRALLAASPARDTALELLRHRLQVVRGRAILDCLARSEEPWARAALEEAAPHALRYVVDDEQRTLEARRLHLRQHGPREWSTFTEQPDAAGLEVRFPAKKNATEMTLHVRQADVKQTWKVTLNDQPLGELVRDECDLRLYLPVPPARLVDGQNVLRIDSPTTGRGTEDDILVGEVRLDRRPLRETLGEASLDVTVLDRETRQPLPARVTIVDAHGALQTTDAATDERQAVRQGIVYVKDGRAAFRVPAGTYVISAGRGFEYSRAERRVDLPVGGVEKLTLELSRETPTSGYVACDTHIHTRTYSGHGDSTIGERMLTLAGEGIELPIATDHNVHIDYELHARQLGVRHYFTPVPGNEVTTPAGHFNIFPLAPGARVPDYRSKEWPTTFREIFATPGARVAILNHARDLHAGVRPFGPELFQATVGERLDGAPLRFNAMEILNSGAIQTDPLQLTRDWMALLNRGYAITPVGSSDSHDVARYVVGQGRTYVRCDDRDVANLDVGAAVDSFLAGRVLVSYGLLAELIVAGKYRSGDLAQVDGDELTLEPRVLGPHWAAVTRVQLYSNGQLIRDVAVDSRETSSARPPRSPGVLWSDTWKLPRPRHDVHLVLVASGPGIASSVWPTARPYQPTSPEWTPRTLGVGGAVWIDGDGNGRREAAREYAERLVARAAGDPAKLLASAGDYDAAVAAQAAHLWRTVGRSIEDDEFARAERSATPAVREGLRAYRESWRDNERARAGM